MTKRSDWRENAFAQLLSQVLEKYQEISRFMGLDTSWDCHLRCGIETMSAIHASAVNHELRHKVNTDGPLVGNVNLSVAGLHCHIEYSAGTAPEGWVRATFRGVSPDQTYMTNMTIDLMKDHPVSELPLDEMPTFGGWWDV